MSAFHPGRPEAGEFAEYYGKYIAKAGGSADPADPVERLASQLKDFTTFLGGIDPAKRLYRYAEDKWSVQEMLQHMTDTERIFAYRALRIARGDQTPLPGFDQDPYVPASEAEAANWDELVREFFTVRESTLALLRLFPQAAWTRMGTASNNPISVRAIAWILAGHIEHHLAVLRERYL